MKRLNISAILVAVILLGCAKEMETSANLDGEEVLVHLNLTGEVTMEDSPLTRVFTSSDLIGIQVYEGSTPYAYGLFDDVSKLGFFLHSGKNYSFECAVVIDGKSKLRLFSNNLYVYYYEGDTYHTSRFHSGDASKDRFSGYLMPFVTKKYTGTKNGNYVDHSGPSLNNKYYSSSNYFTQLDKGQITSSANSLSGKGPGLSGYPKPSGKDKYSEVEKFYGKLTNYTASINGDSINIELKRVSFRVKYTISGITDGNVSITIKNSDQTFISDNGISVDTTSESKLFAFYDGGSAYQYADNYAENFTVGVVWNRGVGVTQDLGTKVIQFRRNSLNHVNINLGESTRSSELEISLEDPEIRDEALFLQN